jgi:hypothetical protein
VVAVYQRMPAVLTPTATQSRRAIANLSTPRFRPRRCATAGSGERSRGTRVYATGSDCVVVGAGLGAGARVWQLLHVDHRRALPWSGTCLLIQSHVLLVGSSLMADGRFLWIVAASRQDTSSAGTEPRIAHGKYRSGPDGRRHRDSDSDSDSTDDGELLDRASASLPRRRRDSDSDGGGTGLSRFKLPDLDDW